MYYRFRTFVVMAASALACAASGGGGDSRPERGVGAGVGGGGGGGSRPELVVTGVAFSERGGGGGGAVLGELLRGALAECGVRARSVAPPAACAAPDAPACLHALLELLAGGALDAALAPAAGPALPPPPRLRDAGVAVWGALDAAWGARRACWATTAAEDPASSSPTPVRSLLDLREEAVAQRYRDIATNDSSSTERPRYFCPADGLEGTGQVAPCEGAGGLATVLVGGAGEARVLAGAARDHGLLLQVRALGAGWDAARALRRRGQRPALLCGRDLALAELGAHALGPPPCARADCPFDARPILKLANAASLARVPSASRALDRLRLGVGGAAALASRAELVGAEGAAREALAALGAREARGEVRVAVLVPRSTRREVAGGRALAAAAELAEVDEAGAALWAAPLRARFKVELADGGCEAPRVFQYLVGALGAEFHSLSAMVGPACAGAFAATARQSAELALPVLAYTPQWAPGALLAAGSTRALTPALAALLAALGWRRVALLSEAALRSSLETARLGAALAAHVELPDEEHLAEDLIEKWAQAAAASDARVLLVVAEDARVVRAALCAGARAGRGPPRDVFVVWGPAPTDGGGGNASCGAHAEGMLLVRPEWAARWEDAPDERWTRRWRVRAGTRAEPPPEAALLYDALRLWAAALASLLTAHPGARDDLHRPDVHASLISSVTNGSAPFVGVTGAFEWEGTARGGGLRVQQWRGGAARDVGQWRGGALSLDAAALRWATADGAPPPDGEDTCWRALRPLATALGAECRAAWVAALVLVLAALLAVLAGGAWHCRRRAEREHRARLAALDMRALGSWRHKPGALDRWELPRERVVINRRLGAGAFGAVYGGHALLGGRWEAVAVKTLKADATTEEKLDFLSEAEAMKRFSDEHVVRLVGAVTRSEPVCTVMELALHGDLKGYLVARRLAAGADADVTPARLTGMARDAARGLAYLARHHFVHRDVAARNCLVSASGRVKLADFGMTRVVFDSEYYRFGRRGMLPVRWMAPESLALGLFSCASDVWAFGVLLYEVLTFGAMPFRGLSNAQVLARVKAGRTLDLPPCLDPQLDALIRSCWRAERRARPTAAALADFLAEWPRLVTPHLAPPDATDGPLPTLSHITRGSLSSALWAPSSAGTDSTYLSAEAPPLLPLQPPTPPEDAEAPLLPPPSPH